MAGKETTVWGIHAGKTGDAETLFTQRKVIALGWDVGDLSALTTREQFKARVAETFPDMKAGAVPVSAGQLYRFMHEAKAGDVVAYPSKHGRHIHLGRIAGPYESDPKAEQTYPHHRAVDWVRSVPRSSSSQGALYEIGSAMSFFQIRNFAGEFLAALEGKTTTPLVVEDETGPEADAIEEYTRDFVLKRLWQEPKGHPLADLVAHLLEKMGYRTRVSPPGPDRGVDILAHRDELGFEPPIIKVQVKTRCESRPESEAGDGGKVRQLALYNPPEGGCQWCVWSRASGCVGCGGAACPAEQASDLRSGYRPRRSMASTRRRFTPVRVAAEVGVVREHRVDQGSHGLTPLPRAVRLA